MAFYEWCTSLGNVQDENAFRDDTQRQEGFVAGNSASSLRVNSALRQANLVVCALMDALGISGNLKSARATLSTDISNALNNTLSYIHLNGSQSINGNLIPLNNASIDLGSNAKKWKLVFAEDINLNGEYLVNKLNNMRTLGLQNQANIVRVEGRLDDYTTNYVHDVQSNININNFHFDRYSLLRMGNTVQFSFKGHFTQQASSSILLQNLSSNFEVLDDLMSYSTILGLANYVNVNITIDGATNTYSNRSFAIVYNTTYQRIEIQTTGNAITNATIQGTAQWFTYDNT